MRKVQKSKGSKHRHRPETDPIAAEVAQFEAAKLAELGQHIELELQKIKMSALLHETFLRVLAAQGELLPGAAARV